jgi:4'-phosphopantetheinyl transferase
MRDRWQSAIPALGTGCCQVWWAHTSAAFPQLLDLLDEEERGRHARFLRGQDRALFLVSHALARIVAARHAATVPRAIRFSAPPSGGGAAGSKPRLVGAASGLELSISHSGQRVVVALSRGVALGVDVERVSSASEESSLVQSILPRSEQRELETLPAPMRPWAFCRYWTRKEAVLKATGDGLSVSPKRIAVSPPTGPPALLRWSGPGRPAQPVHLYDLDTEPGYAAALAAIGSPLECSEHDGSEILCAWR